MCQCQAIRVSKRSLAGSCYINRRGLCIDFPTKCRADQGRIDTSEIAGPAHMGITVAFDQAGTFCNLRSQCSIQLLCLRNQVKPRLDRFLFTAEAPGAATLAAHTGKRFQFQEAGHRG